MTLSDLEQALVTLREQHGNLEVFEALPEYGHCPITNVSLAAFIRFETITYPNTTGRPAEQVLVIGRH